MFNEINGLPVHPLAVHATVLLIPLAGLLGVMFAIPRTRAWSRLPLLVISLGAVVSTYVSKQSGTKFQESKGLGLGGPSAELVDRHAELANFLFIIVLVFAAVAVVTFVLTRGNAPRALVSGLSLLLVVGAVALAVQTYRVGEIGARAVWNPAGNLDYSSSSGD
jgi:uncharacterized membrane protein